MTWVPVADLDELTGAGAIGVRAGDETVALYEADGEIFATQGICTHADACLWDGYLEGGTIECPLHQAIFDIRSGKVIEGPTDVDLKTYPVKVEAGKIFIQL